MAEDDSNTEPPTSTHRLPTVSASDALKSAQKEGFRNISLGLRGLDARILGANADNAPLSDIEGGLVRGHLTELYGPPGVGKTTFCIQASVAALRQGNRVVWVDAAVKLSGPRFKEIFEHACETNSPSPAQFSQDDCLRRFSHYLAPSLAHLLALLLHSPTGFPPTDTSLVVIDSVSTLVDIAYARHFDEGRGTQNNESKRWLAGRRQAVVGELASGLSQLAATQNLAILLTSNSTTKVVAGAEAVLRPAITGLDWESALGARILLYRDWPSRSSTDEQELISASAVRLAEVIKPTSSRPDGVTVVAFTIGKAGTLEIPNTLLESRPRTETLDAGTARHPKKRGHAEVADSDADTSGSDYGWLEDDVEAIAAEGLVDESCL